MMDTIAIEPRTVYPHPISLYSSPSLTIKEIPAKRQKLPNSKRE
jgi:hypothetical protein